MRLRRLITALLSAGLFLATSVIPKPSLAEEGQNNPLPALKEWTILVYLNGHNDLDSYGLLNMNQMEAVGSSDQVNIVVQWATMRANATKRYYITKDSDMVNVSSPVVHNPGLVDMGKRESLVEFIRWAKANYPAKHYLIDVWNHGSGWRKKIAGEQIKDISFDDRFNSHITTEELGLAMQEAAQILEQPVDIYASDACLMAMAEVAGEMATSVRIFVGSQDLEPGEGWPYREFLEAVTANPQADAAAVARMLTQAFFDSYQEGGSNPQSDVTMSAWDMSRWQEFTAAARAFSQAMTQLPRSEKNSIKRAIRASQNFYESDYRDLIDFLNQTEQAGVSATVHASLDTLRAATRNLVIMSLASEYYRGAFGVSIWLPTSPTVFTNFQDRYRRLAFDQAAEWSNLLAWTYSQATP